LLRAPQSSFEDPELPGLFSEGLRFRGLLLADQRIPSHIVKIAGWWASLERTARRIEADPEDQGIHGDIPKCPIEDTDVPAKPADEVAASR
jgi:hypothetical protein